MATAKKAAAKPAAKKSEEAPEAPVAAEQEVPPADVDQGVVRGGFEVGYRGTRTDPADDASYTVAGVLAARDEQ